MGGVCASEDSCPLGRCLSNYSGAAKPKNAATKTTVIKTIQNYGQSLGYR